MRALILAAGKGTRISRYLSGKPKCTVDIGGEELIKYTINLLQKKGVEKIGIVLGYQDKEIKEILKNYKNIEFFYNPFYDITNSLASAWFAKSFLIEDMLIMNADVFVEEKLMEEILAIELSPVLFSDESRKKEADYKLFYKEGVLIDYGKELELPRITGEYIGIAKFKKEFIGPFKENLEKMIREKKYSIWWENVLYELKDQRNIYVKDINNKFWAEVDYIEDYERILKYRKYKLNYSIKIEEIEE